MFNFNNENHEDCPKCGQCLHCSCECGQANHGNEDSHDYDYYETEIETPENILKQALEYFSDKRNIKDIDDLAHALGAFFNEVYAYSQKEFLINQVDAYMGALKQMDSTEKNR